MELVSLYEKEYETREKKEKYIFAQEISEAIINAYSIALQINDNVQQLKSELRRLIQKFSFETPFCAVNLIQFMLKPKKRFTKKDFDGLDEFCRQHAESYENANDRRTAIEFLELGDKVAWKLNNHSDDWRRRIAEHYEKLMEQCEKSPVAAFEYCMEAIGNYQKIQCNKKVKELEQRYSELRDSVEMTTLEVPINAAEVAEIVKACEEYAKGVVRHSTSDDIIRYLISGKDLLPTYQQVKSTVKEHMNKSPTAHFISKVILDAEGNPAQHFSSNKERENFEILRDYRLQLDLCYRRFIREVFFEAILKNKLNFITLTRFITEHCWYGKDVLYQLPNNQTFWLNTMGLITLALQEYFRQMEFFFANEGAHPPNFVLSLDSLTLKIEGLFRQLCRLAGISTSRQRTDRAKRNIVREKDIAALLNDDAIKKLFDEDDLLFFKFLLIEQTGFCLRHRIAHSLIPPKEYHMDYMHLVILALLRLGKYDFTQNSDTTSDK